MSGQPRPDGGSPLDKLNKDVSQYRQTHTGGKPARQVVVHASRAASVERPGLTELDSRFPSQIVLGLLVLGYAVLMLAGCLVVVVLAPAVSVVLWAVMAVGVIVAMIAYRKGRPPLLWFMYGSLLPMVPLVHVALMGKAAAIAVAAGGGQDPLGLGQMQALLGSGQGSSGSMLDLIALVCILGAIPLVHAALIPQNPAASDH